MGLAAHNYESALGTLPPGRGRVALPANDDGSHPSVQATILSYLEQANKYNLFNFNFDIHSDKGSPGVNAAARSQDVPTYLCPSDISDNTYPTATGTAGRSNYFGSFGATSERDNAGDSRAGIFNGPAYTALPAAPLEAKGRSIVSVTDGTSNTAMFAEVRRGTLNYNSSGQRNDTTIVEWGGTVNKYDGRLMTGCDGNASNQQSYGRHVGHMYYRDLSTTSLYNHTLPPNWNRKNAAGPPAQKYGCMLPLSGGVDNAINNAHIPASSYHTGGVNVCMADGSVRLVRDSIDFTQWQNMGSSSGGEVFSDN